MKIAVSACLLGENCRYDGKNCRDEELLRFLEGHEVIPVCPECKAGLPTPRTPIELVDGKPFDRNGTDLSEQLELAVDQTVIALKEQGCELAILMERSPTCGVSTIYDGTFTSKLIDGQGLLAHKLCEANIPVMSKKSLHSC